MGVQSLIRRFLGGGSLDFSSIAEPFSTQSKMGGVGRRMISHLGRKFSPSFVILAVIPTFVSILYFGFIASDVYVSESRFVLRNANKPTVSGIGVLLQSAGVGGGDEARAAQGFITSRDGLRALEVDSLARKAWASKHISIWNRFDPLGLDGSSEALFKYYQEKVSASYDGTGSITTLSVKAYSGEDAEAINRRLLERAEALVNDLNERSQNDLVTFAEQEVTKALAKSTDAALALSEFRNRAGIIDPERQATIQLQMISKLQDELIGARIQLQQVEAVARQNPQILVLRTRINGLEAAINEQMGAVAGGNKSLSRSAVQFQRLQLEREFADRQLASSLMTLQNAREEAGRKRVYVERIAQPSMPDAAVEPRRLRGILATLVLALIAYGIAQMLIAGVREHQL